MSHQDGISAAALSGAAPEPITAQAMEHSLRQALAPTALQVLDESHAHAGHAGANGTGFGTHFRVRVASPLFAGLPRVRQHRLVYDALQEFIDRGAHAIAIEIL